MKLLSILAFAAALASAVPALAADRFGPLITPAELAAAQADPATAPLVLDIRAGTEKDRPVFEIGHIPGAVSAPYGAFRGPKESPGALVPEDKLTATLRALGVTRDRPTVIAHAGSSTTDFGAAARVYWTLKSVGVSHLAILNGGTEGWVSAGLPLEEGANAPSPSDITVAAYEDTWLATRDEVLAIVEGRETARLVDARPEEFWKGDTAHAAAARPGTLPQSQFLVHSTWFTKQPTVIDAEAAKALAEAAGYSADEQLVSFCNTGHWAATNWFALNELAGVDTKLYPESMVGWSNAGLPMDNVPGPLRNLLNQIKGIF